MAASPAPVASVALAKDVAIRPKAQILCCI
jgi:hypothetical protein